MSNLQEAVTLFNGNRFAVKKGLTDEEVYEIALEKGLVTIEELTANPNYTLNSKGWGRTVKSEDPKDPPLEFQTSPVDYYQFAVQKDLFNKSKDVVGQNLDVPLGMAGAAIGAAPVLSVPTAGWSAPALSTAGTFLGSVLSDLYEGKEIEWNNALTDSLIQAGIDVATLKSSVWAGPLLRAFGVPEEKAYKILKQHAEENSEQIGKAGTESSRAISQTLLSSKGGGLSAYQTGNTGAFKQFFESLGDLSLTSSWLTKGRDARNREILTGEIERLLDDQLLLMSNYTKEEIGGVVHGIIDAGSKLNSQIYERGLTQLERQLKKHTVSPKPLIEALESFKNSKGYGGKTETGAWAASKLNKETLKIIDEEIAKKKAVFGNMDAADLIEFQRQLNEKITEAGSFATGNTGVERNLSQLSSFIKKTIKNQLDSLDENLNLGTEYEKLNFLWKKQKENMFFTNKQLVNYFKKGGLGDTAALESFGGILTKPTSAAKVKQLMSAVDEVYALSKNKKIKLQGDDIPKTAEQAKDIIRYGFLKNQFEELGEGTLNWTDKHLKLHRLFSQPDAAAQMEAILGKEKANTFRKLANAIAESNDTPEGFLGGLLVRGREAGALEKGVTGVGGLGAVAAGTGTGIAAGTIAGVGMAGLIFAFPPIASRLVTNKGAVNRLLALNHSAKSGTKSEEFILNSIVRIFNESFTKEELKKMGIEYETYLADKQQVKEQQERDAQMEAQMLKPAQAISTFGV